MKCGSIKQLTAWVLSKILMIIIKYMYYEQPDI